MKLLLLSLLLVARPGWTAPPTQAAAPADATASPSADRDYEDDASVVNKMSEKQRASLTLNHTEYMELHRQQLLGVMRNETRRHTGAERLRKPSERFEPLSDYYTPNRTLSNHTYDYDVVMVTRAGRPVEINCHNVLYEVYPDYLPGLYDQCSNTKFNDGEVTRPFLRSDCRLRLNLKLSGQQGFVLCRVTRHHYDRHVAGATVVQAMVKVVALGMHDKFAETAVGADVTLTPFGPARPRADRVSWTFKSFTGHEEDNFERHLFEQFTEQLENGSLRVTHAERSLWGRYTRDIEYVREGRTDGAWSLDKRYVFLFPVGASNRFEVLVVEEQAATLPCGLVNATRTALWSRWENGTFRPLLRSYAGGKTVFLNPEGVGNGSWARYHESMRPQNPRWDDNGETHTYAVELLSVRPEDEGLYSCVSDEGEEVVTRLNVLRRAETRVPRVTPGAPAERLTSVADLQDALRDEL